MRILRLSNLRWSRQERFDEHSRQVLRGSIVVIAPPDDAGEKSKSPPHPTRKYFTWHCIGLHVIALVLVSAFLLAGWWQYHVALSGNGLSWAYTVEWPAFAVYAVYMWWKLIHLKHVPLDKDWAVKARADAEAAGIPLHEIPGCATDKSLWRAVIAASREHPETLASSLGKQTHALESFDQKVARANLMAPNIAEHGVISGGLAEVQLDDCSVNDDDDTGRIIDTRAISSTVVVDEELAAYNRYLFELSQRDPPKRWRKSGA